jgi:hypothetical protein
LDQLPRQKFKAGHGRQRHNQAALLSRTWEIWRAQKRAAVTTCAIDVERLMEIEWR